jgi:hypothetical protein
MEQDNFDDLRALVAQEEATPVPVQEDNFDDLRALVADVPIDQKAFEFQARLESGFGGMEHMDPKTKRKIAKELAAEKERRDKIMGEWESPDKGSELMDTYSTFGNLLKNTFWSASTAPTKVITENKARWDGGENTVDLENAVGSVVNLVKSLAPGGQTPGQALDNFTIRNKEGARAFLRNLYTQDIIDENGTVNIESLEYSDVPRWMQNELAALWATQRTGIGNIEVFRKILKSRLGVTKDDDATAGAKRVGQMVDTMGFNIPSKINTWARTRGDTDIYSESRNLKHDQGTPMGVNEALLSAPVQDPIYDQASGQWLVYPQRGGTPAVVPDYNPNATPQERQRQAAKALLDDTIGRMEMQAMEAGPQLLDPSILLGIGVGKKALQTMSKLGKTGASVSSKLRVLEPSLAGMAAASAGKVRLTNTAQAINNVMRSQGAAGVLARTIDKTATTSALVAGLSGLGAPKTMELDSAVAGGLLSAGFSPLHLAASLKPSPMAVSNASRDALREIMKAGSTGDFSKMSNYSKRYLDQQMRRMDLKTPEEFHALLRSSEALDATLPDAIQRIDQSEMTPAAAMEYVKQMAGDKEFQKTANEMMKLFDNYGRTWEGILNFDALSKTREEMAEHLYKTRIDAAMTGHGSSSVPQTTAQKGNLKAFTQSMERLPSWLLNDPAKFREYLQGEISGTPVEWLQPRVYMFPDSARTVLGQLDARDRTTAYMPIAQAAILTSTALKEQAPLMKTIAIGETVGKYQDLMNLYRQADPEEVLNFISELKGVQTSGPKENPLERIIRHRSKGEQDIISPSVASVRVAEQLEDAGRRITAKRAEIEIIDDQLKQLRDESKKVLGKGFENDANYLQQKAAFDTNRQIVIEEISDILANTSLGKIFDHTRDLTTRYVKHQKALSDAMDVSNVEIADASRKLAKAAQDTGIRGAKTEQERLLDTSRRMAAEDRSVIEEQKNKYERGLILRQQTRDKILKDLEAELKLPNTTARAGDAKAMVKQAGIQVKNGTASPKTIDLLNRYRSARNAVAGMKKELKYLDADLTAYDNIRQRIDDEKYEMSLDKMASLGSDAKWVDEFLVAGKALGISDTPAYINILNKVSNLVQMNSEHMRKYGSVLGIPEEDIAMVRFLGSDSLWMGAYGIRFSEEQKPLLKAFKKRANVLADMLAQGVWNSKIQAEAHQVLIDISKNPARGSLKDLLTADKVLHDTYHISRVLAEQKDPNGIFAKTQALATKIGRGEVHVTKNDYNTLRVLLTDSGIGKAYVTTAHLENLGIEPWMVTYKQDSVMLMDNLLKTATAHTDRIIAETKTFLTEAGMINSPEGFDEKMAAAFLFGSVNGAGASGGGLFDLLSLANAWQAKTGVIDNPYVPTESIALSLDRNAGISTLADLREVFAASNVAALEKDKWAKPLITKLRTFKSGDELYIDHMRPSSPVRKMINRMFIGTTDRALIDTVFPEFARSGYSEGMTFFKVPEHRAGMTPLTSVDREHVRLTDHLIVNGQLTAMGKVFEEIHKSGAEPKLIIDNYLEKLIPERKRLAHPAEYSGLKNFILQRVGGQNASFGRLRNYNQWDLVKRVTAEIQAYDKKGLEEINRLSETMNKKYGTSYAPIEYNPWRLDIDVVTERDAVTKEPGLLGSWRDADKFAGNRYRTTPDAQVAKAQTSGIAPEEIIYSPEANYLNRYNRLYNDVLSRKARKNLIEKAVFMELIGYKNVAEGIKKNILEAGNLGDNSMTWTQKMQNKIIGSDNKVLAASGLAARQIFNPMVTLASFFNTVVEQPLQQMALSVNANPSVRGAASSLLDAIRYTKEMGPNWFGGMFNAILKDMDTLSRTSNGENMSLGGTHLQILENIYAGQTKRVDPMAQQLLMSLQRGGTGFWRRASEASAEGYGFEAAALKSLWAVKERAENTAVRSTLKTLGGIMATGDKILKEQGAAALVKHLNQFLGGHSNPALIMDVVREIQNGRVDVGWERFGREYVSARVGTWNHSNTPKFIRGVARWVPGADQFFTAGTIGTYRILNSIIGLQNIPAKQRARMVVAALSVAGIASGIGILQEESGVEWYGRISPVEVLSTATRHAWSTEASTKDSLTTLFNSIGTRAQIQSGASQGLTLRATYSILKMFNDIYMKDMLKEKDTLKRGDKDYGERWNALILLSEMTAFKPGMSVLNMTPKEAADTIGYMSESLHDAYARAVGNSTMSQEDAELLVTDIEGRYGDARKLAEKLLLIESETGESPFTRAEEMSIAMLSLWPSVLEAQQSKLWKKYAPGIDREIFTQHLDDKVSIYAQGLAGGSQSAAKLVALYERAIARYDERVKRNEALRSGSDAPVVSLGDWRREQDAAQSEAEAEFRADQEAEQNK